MQIMEHRVGFDLPFVTVFSSDLSILIISEELLRTLLPPALPDILILLALGNPVVV